jgi:acyl carrier protein
MQDKIIEILKDVLRLDDDIEITRETNILMDLDGDSLDVIETVIDIEEEFDCNIKEEDLESVVTVGDLIDLVQSSMN